jgi:hypothetical protein
MEDFVPLICAKSPDRGFEPTFAALKVEQLA